MLSADMRSEKCKQSKNVLYALLLYALWWVEFFNLFNASRIVLTTLHFIHNLRMDPISCTVTSHKAGKTCQGL